MTLVLSLFYISVGFLPSVPTLMSATAVFFVATFLTLSFAVFYKSGFKVRFDGISFLISIFLFVWLPINFLVGLNNGLSPSELGRGMVPFVFLSSYFVFNQLPESRKSQLPKFLMLAAFTWAALILVLNFSEFLAALQGELSRLTYAVSSLLVPLGLVGLAFTIYEDDMPKLLRGIGFLLFLSLILTSGYRSQLALAVVMILFRYRNILRRESIAPLFVIAAALITYAFVNASYLEMMIDRFIYSLGDDVRSLEVDFAMDVFSQSPFLGSGAGYHVPVEAVRPVSLYEKFENKHVSYIHNFLAYSLMCFGAFGTLILGAILLSPIFRNISFLMSNTHKQKEAAIVLLLILLTYFQVSASFRQIQMWVVISCLLVIIQSPRRRDHV